jgi:hypothetical protein
MPQWEYSKRDLSEVPAKLDDIDLLNEAGREGWELLNITTNNIAYFKRPQGGGAAASEPPAKPAATRRRAPPPRDSDT